MTTATQAPSTTLDIIQQLCDPAEMRAWMRQPFMAAGHLTATNGHILIAASGASTDATTEKLPASAPQAVKRAIDASKDSTLTAWVRADAIALPTLNKCPCCDGRGHAYEELCDECGGAGEFAHGNHTYCCKNCTGNGCITSTVQTASLQKKRLCNSCNGTGEDPQHTAALGAYYGSHYLRMLARLPNCEVHPPETPDAVTLARFDGGVACLMPRRGD